MHWKFRLRQINLEIQRLLGFEEPAPVHDDLAIENETVFHVRFGFDCNRFWRGKVVEFKQKRDLTDRDIRALHRNGLLQFGNGALEISRWWWIMPTLGALHIAMTAFPIVHLILLVFFVHPPRTVSDLLAVVAFAGIYTAVVWSLHWFYIAPIRTWRRHMHNIERKCVAPIGT